MTLQEGKRMVFFGTPEWAVPSLDALFSGPFEISAVVTNPDRPAGRGYELKASAIKERALELGLPVIQPEKARDPEFVQQIAELQPDVAVVVAYGKILPSDLLDVPPHGFVNMHFSLLPAYRGAAPVQRAVMDGLSRTGASIMVLTEGMDEGPVLAVEEVDIGPSETAGELGTRLAEVGAALLARSLVAYLGGQLNPQPQDHAAATYAPKIGTEEARIDWSEPATVIKDKVRGLNPVPGAWSTIRGKRLKVGSVQIQDAPSELSPGEVRPVETGLTVGTGTDPVLLETVQIAGKKAVTGSELARGLHFTPGERLGEDVAHG